ncbi:uncharacterized protein HHUB_1031 [Halobacterium hubeiense]|jgi:hypothetical protein|uniref:Uncharacterized protein n=1 Tax=Halobacterium hubeiense TaxID=1407499 RepID=A0A0U5GZE0_9EURY|nr:hypothetical protein [Halobacterium hubeiense]CQH44138.1 uncharacterized protein HHUB_1031 [Halobacterium hubeiense]
MQRRAAAVSVVVFILLAAGAYTFIGAAQQPDVTLENPDYTVSADETLTLAGTSYSFTEVSGDSATAEWTNESARYTESWSANDTVVYQGSNYSVVIPSQTDPTEFELREVQTVDRPTVEQDGTTYVIVEEDGERRLVERDEYLDDPVVHEFVEGDAIERPDNDNETRVASVTNSSVTVEWFAPQTNEVSFDEGENTTVGDTAYLAHFEQQGGSSVLQLTTDYEDYHSDVEAQQEFHERTNGLWGIAILSALAAALLVMLAFMPSRY